MKMTDLRAKARSIFGNAIAEPMPNQPNGAKALQQRANARPIPTYKVGGVVKKQDGGRMSGRNTPEADDVLITTRRGQRILDEQKKREAEMERKRREKQARADKLLGIPAQKGGGKAGCYKDGGKPKKDGLAVMIAIGKTKPVKKAAGGTGRANMRSEPEAKNPRGLKLRVPVSMPAPPMPTPTPTAPIPAPPVRKVYKEGGAPVKRAVGGAGKTRKGMAPIKKAQGGAAKVRKGMMSETGDIKQVVKPKKGLGGM